MNRSARDAKAQSYMGGRRNQCGALPNGPMNEPFLRFPDCGRRQPLLS